MEKNASLLTFLILLVISPLIVHSQVNDYRVTNKLKPLIFDTKLCAVAEVRANQIQTDWSHKGFLKEVKKIKYAQAGENLAKDFNNETDLVQAWIKSKPHRQNLLRQYTSHCIVCTNNHCAQILRSN